MYNKNSHKRTPLSYNEYFHVIDQAGTTYHLSGNKAVYILWENPFFNQQQVIFTPPSIIHVPHVESNGYLYPNSHLPSANLSFSLSLLCTFKTEAVFYKGNA